MASPSRQGATAVVRRSGAGAGTLQAAGLLAAARRLHGELNALVEDEPAGNGGNVPTLVELFAKLDEAFRRQGAINRANAQLGSINFVMNVSNAVRNSQLQTALRAGHARLQVLQANIHEHYETIERLRADVRDLDSQVVEQRAVSTELQAALSQKEGELRQSIEKYAAEVEEQRRILADQQQMTKTLLKVRFNQDFLVDGSLLAAAWWIVNMSLIDVPIGWLSRVAGPRGRQQAWVRQLAKLAVMASIYVVAREQAKVYGLHGNVGAWLPYVQSAVARLWSFAASPKPAARPEESA